MGTESEKPEMFTLTYPATRFCTIPRPRPPMKARGMDRSRPTTAAAAATMVMVRYPVVLIDPRMGAATTPARAARTVPMIQA